jgi:broad specificity phosphatase PhoE
MIEPATEPPRIFCIRHGETVWSLLRKHTGPASLGVLS